VIQAAGPHDRPGHPAGSGHAIMAEADGVPSPPRKRDLLSWPSICLVRWPEIESQCQGIAGITAHPTGEWATQQARNLVYNLGTRLESLRFLIRDRDTKYTHSFDHVFHTDDIEILKTPPQAPKGNSHCERVIGTLRREVLDHILIVNTTHAHHVLTEYARHYNQHRPHQTRDQRPPDTITSPLPIPHHNRSRVVRTRVLSSLINEYHHVA